MNGAQKTGVGMILGVIIFGVPAILEAFGVHLPGWVPLVGQAVTTIAGILGIVVNLPSRTS